MTQSSAGGAPRAMEHPEARLSLGVYVLGAIDPAERSQVDAHLATCQDCRDELAGLAGLPALLSRVSKPEAIALAAADDPLPAGFGGTPEAPPELLASVLDLTAARRRRRRRLEAGLGVAAAVIVAAGVFGGLQLGSSPASTPAATGALYAGAPNGAWQSSTGQSGAMAATVQFRSMGWGTMLAAKVSGIPIGTSCQLWVVEPGGQRVLAGNWMTDKAEGTVWYPGSVGLPSSDIKAFQVTVAHGGTIGVSA